MRVLQLIDSLNAGGAERMAVSYANELVNHIEVSYLCATRKEGLLKSDLNGHVAYVFLNKKASFDMLAFLRLYKFVSKNKIEIVHAHSSSFFFATLLKFFRPKLTLIWHDHYGNSEMLKSRNHRILKYCSTYFDAIISVNENLKDWAQKNLKCNRVYYLRNFASNFDASKSSISLKGKDELRIVCLANIREQKDHLNLLRAFKIIQEKHPFVSLHLLGEIHQGEYYNSLVSFIEENKLEEVYFYDSQNGVISLISNCHIGVLSSKSEGLPVALLEYGLARLAVVCTNVGQCMEVINGYGQVVESNDSEALSNGILFYINNRDARKEDALQFSNHIKAHYSFNQIISEVLILYKDKNH